MACTSLVAPTDGPVACLREAPPNEWQVASPDGQGVDAWTQTVAAASSPTLYAGTDGYYVGDGDAAQLRKIALDGTLLWTNTASFTSGVRMAELSDRSIALSDDRCIEKRNADGDTVTFGTGEASPRIEGEGTRLAFSAEYDSSGNFVEAHPLVGNVNDCNVDDNECIEEDAEDYECVRMESSIDGQCKGEIDPESRDIIGPCS